MSNGSRGARGISFASIPDTVLRSVELEGSRNRGLLWDASAWDPSGVPGVALFSRASVALLPVKDSSSDSSFKGECLRFRIPGSSSSMGAFADSMLRVGLRACGRKATTAKGGSVNRDWMKVVYS